MTVAPRLDRGCSATWVACAVALAVSLGASRAWGYTYESIVTDGCHELLAKVALRQVRGELDTAAPLPNSADDQLLIDDLTFGVEGDLRDIGAVTLLLGVRDNDVKGRASTDTSRLALIHGDPDAQHEHCLRRPEHDEPTGSEQALALCRSYILEHAELAIDRGLDAAGWPDAERRAPLTVTLAFRGEVRPELPAFYVYLGQAMHALQDSFSHTYRTADGKRVTAVLNWVDYVDDYDESRDGPPHLTALDRCDNPDELRSLRRQLATQASAILLRTALDPSLSRAAKRQGIDALLDELVGFEPGCTPANHWCNAPENAYRDEECGCRLPGSAAPRWPGVLWIPLVLAACWRWRHGGERLWGRRSTGGDDG